MKTFVITTKNPKVEYEKIVNNWFNPSLATQKERIEIESTIEIDPLSDQSVYNNLEFRQDGDYQFFLPEVVDPNLSSRHRSEYVLDLLCVISDAFNIKKEDLYLIAHSRDLFSLEDARSGYGLVFNKSLNCSNEMRLRVSQSIEDGHIFQFHHNSNEVANLLLYLSPKKGETLSTLGDALYNIVKKERIKALGDL